MDLFFLPASFFGKQMLLEGKVNVFKPELLAPAGDFEAMRAAVANGADAVYFGIAGFNARHRATNFTLDELPRTLKFLHDHNVRGYVAFNTLVFSDELEAAAEHLARIAEAGADAIIVQDLGIAQLLSRLAPALPVHGSTQMTLTEALGVEFVRGLGIQRVILARELSIADIRLIAERTSLPLEVFVHGALCVAYSGQCLTSEALGGRSANRGQCAQACRLPYELIVNGDARDLGEKAYLLSPQDLAAHDLIGELASAGVCSFKIEGRLKSPQYVASTTQTYRAAIDSAIAARPFKISPQQSQDLAQTFSRGFTHGFLGGVDHQELVHARFPKSRGVLVGKVVGRNQGRLVVHYHDAAVMLKPGDGVVIDEGRPQTDEQGGRIFEAFPRGMKVEVGFGRDGIAPHTVAVGALIWKTDDPVVRKRLEASYQRDVVVNREKLHVRLSARVGELLMIELSDAAGRSAAQTLDQPLALARNQPITEQTVRDQFSRLGDTPFELGDVEFQADAVMVPRSVLNDLRRKAVEDLMGQRARSASHDVLAPDALAVMRSQISQRTAPAALATQWYVLVRSMEQLDAVLGWQAPNGATAPAMVYCEFEDIRQYPDAVRRAHAVHTKIGLASVRIIKPHEHGLLKKLADAAPDAVLIRNLAGLQWFRTQAPAMPLVGDYALNIANELAADTFIENGLIRLTPSYDLTWRQLSAMLGRMDPGWFEVVMHQHMPMFHMEHCVFCHTLSKGTDFRNCGRPCDTNRVELRDRSDHAHPLVADVGCRNTVYNATPQSAASFAPRMIQEGLMHFRIELLRENAQASIELLNRYASVIFGLANIPAPSRRLTVLSQLGVTHD